MATTTITLNSFDDFLQVARQQTEPQQLLFVFTRAESPQQGVRTDPVVGDADAARSIDPGTHRGLEPDQPDSQQTAHLAPIVCVDKAPRDIASFALFADEAEVVVQDWSVFFVAALPGIAGHQPTPLAIDESLDRMVDAVRLGEVGTYLAFDRTGRPLQIGLQH